MRKEAMMPCESIDHDLDEFYLCQQEGCVNEEVKKSRGQPLEHLLLTECDEQHIAPSLFFMPTDRLRLAEVDVLVDLEKLLSGDPECSDREQGKGDDADFHGG